MFKSTCFVFLVKLFLITAIMPFGLLAFFVMCVSNISLLSSQILRSFSSCTSFMFSPLILNFLSISNFLVPLVM